MGIVGARRYTGEERAAAVDLAMRIGQTVAAKQLGIPLGTVSRWACQTQHQLSGGQKEHSLGNGQRSVSPVESQQPLAAAGRPAPQPVSSPKVADGLAEQAVPAPNRHVAKVYTPSQRAQALEYAAKHGPTAASKQFGISRFSLRDWRRKAQRHAKGERVANPLVGSDENQAAARDLRILAEWRAHPGLGPTQVRNQLRRQGFKVSTHTVRCVLDDNGYVAPKSRRQDAHDNRYEAVRPNQLWHLDFLHRHIHKQAAYTLLIVDDYSRFIVGGAIWDGERSAAVIETFSDAVSRHGQPKMAMSDGGSAFYAWRGISQFTGLLDELEIDQLIAKQPQTNGKLEVLNANIAKELFNQETFFDLGEAQRRLRAWIGFYNFRRTHTALGGLLVPADRYFGRADEVLAQIEAGRAPDGLGEPIPVGERQLDLFRISSRGGQVEIHLMGRRIEVPIK